MTKNKTCQLKNELLTKHYIDDVDTIDGIIFLLGKEIRYVSAENKRRTPITRSASAPVTEAP